MKKFFFAFITFILYAQISFAAVTASVSSQNVQTGQPFTFEITSDSATQERPDLSVLKDLFDVVSTSVSQKSYIINGKASSQTIWRFSLVTQKTGRQLIPSISLGAEKTDPVFIDASDQPEVKILDNNTEQKPTQTPSPRYNLSAELKKTAYPPFIQQQLTYIVTLEDDGNLQGDAPYFENSDDFIIRPLAEPSVSTSPNGKRLVSFPFALFAQKSGRLKLPDVQFDGVSYQTPDSVNFFDTGFFQIQMPSIFGIQTPVHLKAEGKTIEIKPALSDYEGKWWLPAEKITLSSGFQDMPQSITQGTPIVREITLKAEGLTDTQLPELSFAANDDFRIYPEKPSVVSASTKQKIISEQKTLVTYIPQKAGDLELPEISVIWYNTQTQKIEKAIIPSTVIHISEVKKSAPVSPKNDFSQKSSEHFSNKFLSENPFYFYIGIAAAFICGILLSFLLFKLTNRAPTTHQKANKVLKRAQPQNDLKLLRDDIISKTQKAYPKHLITNLEDVAEILGDELLKKEKALFLKALYSGDQSSFNAETFLKTYHKAVKNKQKKTKEKEPIPPLYSSL